MANSISVSISQVSQNVASNSSVIRVSLTAYFQYYASSGQTSTAYCTIDGNNFSFTAPTYSVGNGGSVHLGSFDRTIAHSSDGSRSVSVSAEWYPPYVYPSGLSFKGSNSIWLTTIPRASTFSISGNTMGSGMTINISRASSGFTHLVRYAFGSITRDYGNQGTSCGFTPPLSDASQIPNATSGTGRITVYTYSGGTHIGTTSEVFTLYLPSSVVPSFSSLNMARVDNGVPSSWGIYVQGISKASLSIGGASGIYGSSISAYSISGGGYSTGSSSFTTGALGAGNITFTGTITDSRGRSVSKSVSITVHANYIPSLTLRAERCNSSGTANNAGTYIKITPTYSCASINGKNAIASKRFAIAGTSYANTTGASGASFILGNNDIIVSRSYTVTGNVVDSLGQSTGNISVTVSSEAVPFNLRNDGVGFGKYCERNSTIDSAWAIVAPAVTCEKLAPQNISCSRGNELVFESSNDALWFGYRVGTNGVKITNWYFGNGSGGRGGINASSVYTDNWFRSTGDSGWYSQTYGGGISMTDSTWLRVYGGKKFFVNNTAYDSIFTTGGVKTNDIIGNGVSGGNIMHVSADRSRVYLGNASLPYLYLEASSQVYSLKSIIVNSDRRLKTNIESLDSIHNKIANMYSEIKVKKYAYNYTRESEGINCIGIVAQELLDTLSVYGLNKEELGLVTKTNKEGMLGINYDSLNMLSVVVIQDLMGQVKSLNEQVKEITGKTNNMEKAINEIYAKIEGGI